MTEHLVIVESAGKIKKINEYLGSDYIVKASFGHFMDLDKNTLSIDIENNYKPLYIITNHKIVNELKNIKCKSVIIASDNDREGEAIAWSLQETLKLDNPDRIIFTEITKKAIECAINNPTKINMNMVYAQQARRLLDRLVGYKISPLLKNLNAKSAGRVQSVVVKIINDKEIEINNTELILKLKMIGEFHFTEEKKKILMKCNNNILFNNKESAIEFLKLINKNSVFKVIKIENKESISNPSSPFVTSTLQQEASTKLKFNIKKTMEIAQKLYEAGYITYMRTDSVNLSKDAINSCKNYIIKNFGVEYSNPKNYSSSNNSQQAHEAIRPTNLNLENIGSNDKDQIKLYNLIWKRTIASQMSAAKINIETIYIDTLNNNQ